MAVGRNLAGTEGVVEGRTYSIFGELSEGRIVLDGADNFWICDFGLGLRLKVESSVGGNYTHFRWCEIRTCFHL